MALYKIPEFYKNHSSKNAFINLQIYFCKFFNIANLKIVLVVLYALPSMFLETDCVLKIKLTFGVLSLDARQKAA